MQPSLRLVVCASALSFVLFACPKRVTSSTEALDDAKARVAKGTATARDYALAGLAAFIVDADVTQAQGLLTQALSKDAKEPYALYGQVLLAEREAHPEKSLEAALQLLAAEPSHPLASVAARVVVTSVGLGRSTDQLIVDRAPALLGALSGDAAHVVRSALLAIAVERNDAASRERWLKELGAPSTTTLIGPFGAWHRLSMANVTPVEQSGSFDNVPAGPFGALVPRELHFQEGRFTLGGEPSLGDVYVVGFDVEVPEATTYVVRTVTAMDHVATLDGTQVLQRLSWLRPAPTLTTQAVKLTAGKHRLLVRCAKEEGQGELAVALSRLDGKPSNVVFTPALHAAPSWSGLELDASLGSFNAAQLHDALHEDASDVLAAFIAVKDAMGRDREGAKRLLATIPPDLNSPAVAVLRAEVALGDRFVPAKVARGKATRDLEAALQKDKGYVRAVLATAQLALDDGRQLEALEQVKAARALTATPGAPVLLLEARIEQALGLEAQAGASAREASVALAGHCEALTLQYDLARRRDAVAEADALLEQAQLCPGSLARGAEHWRSRGQLERAQQAYDALLALDDGQVSWLSRAIGVRLTQHHHDDAIALVTRLMKVWPRSAQLPKQLADIYEHAGKTAEALAAREAALKLDGADLQLLRSVARAKTGKELLDEYAISTEEALKAYEAAPGNEEATSAYLLDAAAIRAFADGSQVDRIHIIQKALDQSGVQGVAEVNIPSGAIVLKLRAIKADGTTQEPEGIENKDGVSLPGVQVGDLVEYEFLQAHPSRGPGQPGFTSSSFYFQVARQPNNWSTYVVEAPKGSGLKVDAHNMATAPPPPVVEGNVEVFRHAEHRVAPYIPEPMGPTSPNEFIPFVSVGAGQQGNDGVVQAYADAFIDKGAITFEVEQFAKKAVGDAKGMEAVKALYAAVMQLLSGRDSGLSTSAAASVVADRGSRTWLLFSSLIAAGFDARLVAVHTLTADPAPYLFPNEAALPYVCVRVALPEGGFAWLDPLVRFAPFGELPEWAMGERDAFVLPVPGKPLEKTKTPPAVKRPSKTVKLDVSLAEDGVLTGAGEETYDGYEAAQLAEALESISADQRDQALQGALSRYFGGADLSNLDVKAKREVGGTVTVKYQFRAPRFGRVDSGKLVLGAFTFPSLLGRRFLATGSRTTPLYVEASEATKSITNVKLPKGWVIKGAVQGIALKHGEASFRRNEVQTGDAFVVEQELRLVQGRIAPKDYEAFGQFVGEVDLIESRDLLLEKP